PIAPPGVDLLVDDPPVETTVGRRDVAVERDIHRVDQPAHREALSRGCDRQADNASREAFDMEARIVSFPSSQSGVRVSGDRIEVDRLVLADGPLAAWLAAQPLDDQGILV